MTITAQLVLPEDVHIVAVSLLPAEVREKLSHEEGDYAITRAHARTYAKVIDRNSAALLERFRSPGTYVEKILTHCEEEKLDPAQTLEDSFPVIFRLYQQRFLVSPDAADSKRINRTLTEGTRVGAYVVSESLQVLPDTEVYLLKNEAGGDAVLKIARASGDARTNDLLANEVEILERLEGTMAPKLLSTGEHEERTYLVMEHCRGVDAASAARATRAQREASEESTLEVCRSIARAYAELHERGVVHGDVHPGNVLVAGEKIHVIDFGLATTAESSWLASHRGGVAFYLSPETVSSHRKEVTPASEQYSLAALLYFLLTGAHYIDFGLERDQLRRQIVSAEPLPFAHHKRAPNDALESVLRRALSKEPDARYANVREFSLALNACETEPRTTPKAISPVVPSIPPAVARLLERAGSLSSGSAALALPSPRCSINYGAAGIAYFLYRLASIRDDSESMVAADLWLQRAYRDATSPGAFHNTELEITSESVGETSLFHSESGIACIAALAALQRGDSTGYEYGSAEYVRLAERPSQKQDLTLGLGSLLLGMSAVCEAAAQSTVVSTRQPVIAAGRRLTTRLWEHLDTLPDLTHRGAGGLALAHGWAGHLFATIRWSLASGDPLPAKALERLDELAALGVNCGRSMRWPARAGQRKRPSENSSWCNGTAGHALLWGLSWQLTKDARYLVLAERAALDSWDSRDSYGSLCCGLAGRAYASLMMYRLTTESAWLDRAKVQASEAVASVSQLSDVSLSLFKGELGVALLCADLEQPTTSSLPLVESEYSGR